MLLKHTDEDAASDIMLKIDDLSSDAYSLGYDEGFSSGQISFSKIIVTKHLGF